MVHQLKELNSHFVDYYYRNIMTYYTDIMVYYGNINII